MRTTRSMFPDPKGVHLTEVRRFPRDREPGSERGLCSPLKRHQLPRPPLSAQLRGSEQVWAGGLGHVGHLAPPVTCKVLPGCGDACRAQPMHIVRGPTSCARGLLSLETPACTASARISRKDPRRRRQSARDRTQRTEGAGWGPRVLPSGLEVPPRVPPAEGGEWRLRPLSQRGNDTRPPSRGGAERVLLREVSASALSTRGVVLPASSPARWVPVPRRLLSRCGRWSCDPSGRSSPVVHPDPSDWHSIPRIRCFCSKLVWVKCGFERRQLNPDQMLHETHM